VVVVSVGFYATWLVFDPGGGVPVPLDSGALSRPLLERVPTARNGTCVNTDFFLPALQFSLCVLNFKWTFDLMLSAVRRFRQQREAGRRRCFPRGERAVS